MDHFYIERSTGRPVKEKLFSDRLISFLYHPVRENFSFLFNILTGRLSSKTAAFFNYDFPFILNLSSADEVIKEMKIKKDEFFNETSSPMTPRSVFERKIRYWEKRPLDSDTDIIASPSDSRIITGNESDKSLFFIKEKFFSYEELISKDKPWADKFRDGSFAVFRLTPDKYHYNHSPVSGIVADYYEIDGKYHSCNPLITSRIQKPCQKNKRAVTIIDTDTENGTNAGLVCMIEVAALMIGEIIQCYSKTRYNENLLMDKNLFLKKGQPKSRFAPGSSTVILLFEKGKIKFDADQNRSDVLSRFSSDFTTPIVETEVNVRESIGRKI